jgi:hypothetical protein
MIEWLREKLGINDLERRIADLQPQPAPTLRETKCPLCNGSGQRITDISHKPNVGQINTFVVCGHCKGAKSVYVRIPVVDPVIQDMGEI